LKGKNTLIKIYKIAPYLDLIKNKIRLIIFIIFFQSSVKLKLKKGIEFTVHKNELAALVDLLGILMYSLSFSSKQKNMITVSLDDKNEFTFSLDLSLSENVKLLSLFHNGIKFGVHFQSNSSPELKNYEKTIKILEIDGKKIIETSNGIKFYVESIAPWIIIETFVLNIHGIGLLASLNEKVVVDIGANIGDTTLYYASQGATVYAFEPIKTNYEAMLKNIKLNPKFAKKIVPINAAIGTDGKVKIHQSKLPDKPGEASVFYHQNDSDFTTTEVKGYKLNSALREFNIKNIDLLKLDCKGCEFLLDDLSLRNVKVIKIEYTTFNSHKLEDLISLLQRNGFKTVIYQHNPRVIESLLNHGTLIGEKT